MVIENVLAGKGEPKGWAITEVVEKGDGAWAKVCDSSEARIRAFPKLNFLTAFNIHFGPHSIRSKANISSPTQGTTIEHGGERAGASLSSMGWTGKRGDGLPPVWVVVHRV
jgi:hypothetical protein